MQSSPGTTNRLLIGLVVLAAIAAGGMAVVWLDPTGREAGRLPAEYRYDLKDAQRVDPKLIRFRQTAEYPVPLAELRALTVGIDSRIYVAGDSAVCILAVDGKKAAEIALPAPATCLAVARGGEVPADGKTPDSVRAEDLRLYVGLGDHIEVFTMAGKPLARWKASGERSLLTAIAVQEPDAWVADAGKRIVWRYRTDGTRIGSLGTRDAARGIQGFIVPSPYFDLALSPDGLLRVTNPGWHRVEAYTAEGDLELFWGKSGLGIASFCGCCNPAHLAVLPDGRIVTAEKGLVRVKVHAADGTFESVVAAPEQLASNPEMVEETRPDHRLPVFDVAADAAGRVWVLDPLRRSVRVFEEKPSP